MRVEGEIQREMTILVFILLHIVTVSSRQINSRDSWLLNLSHGNVLPNTEWTALNQTEQAIFNMKADDWFRHAMRQGDAGHLQFGQIMPQVLFSNPESKSSCDGSAALKHYKYG